MTTSHTDYPFSPEKFQLIGEFVAQWNYIETQIDLFAVILLNVKFDALRAIMGAPNVPPRADIIIELTKEKVSDLKIQNMIISCMENLKKVSNDRNLVIHGRWSFNHDENVLTAQKKFFAGQKIDFEWIKNKNRELEILSNRIKEAFFELLKYFEPEKFSGLTP